MSDTVGSVGVEIYPDATGWSERVRAKIGNTVATIQANVDTAEANAQLDEAAHTRTATIKADVSQLSKGNDVLGSFVDKLGLLPALAIAGGAALVPLAATIGGIAAALAAPLAVAAGGATVFAFLAGFAVKDTEKQLKNIDTLHKKLTGLTKGTASYNDTLKQLNQAQSALTPGQVKFAGALDKLKLSFHDLLAGKSGEAMLGVVSQALDLLAKSLPVVAPLLDAVSRTFGQLLGELGDKVGSQGFADFIARMAHQVGPDLTAFAHILGNFTVGLGGLFGVLDRKSFSGGVLKGLEDLSARFRDFGTGSSGERAVRGFFDYVHKVGPGVGDAISGVARALAAIVRALAPLGPPVLAGLAHAANALASIPTPVLTGLAAATAGLVAFNKLGGFKATGFLLGKVGGSSGTGILGSLGVQKVFVVNMPGGGLGLGAGVTAAEGAASVGIAGRIAKAMGVALPTAEELGPLGRFLSRTGLDLPLPALGSQVLSPGTPLPVPTPRQAYAGLYGPGGKYNGNMYAASRYTPETLGKFGLTESQARNVLGDQQIRSTGTALDALSAHAAAASQQVDRIGPNASASLVGAVRAIGALQSKIDALHGKKLAIIADTSQAIHSLEVLQAYRLHNKYFTVYQRSQGIDRAVGPGGGIGSTPHTGGPQGGSGGGSGRSPVHVHLDDSGRHTLTGFMDESADRVYHANRDYEDAQAGR